MLTDLHRAVRLAFTRQHPDWQPSHWQPVLVTGSHRAHVEESGVICARSAIQHDQFGSGAAVLWGGRCSEGRSLMVVRHRDQTFRPTVRPEAGAVSVGFLLLQDNTRPHVARVMMKALISLSGPLIPQTSGTLSVSANNTTACPGEPIRVWEEIPRDTIHRHHEHAHMLLGAHRDHTH